MNDPIPRILREHQLPENLSPSQAALVDVLAWIRLAELLSGTYTVVATNTPFLARGKMAKED